MMLSSKGRLAAMVMMRLALQEGKGPVPLATLASEQCISVSCMEQHAAVLRRAGLVRAEPGPGGGYLLARPASQINLVEIIAAADRPVSAGKYDPALSHAAWEDLCVSTHEPSDRAAMRIFAHYRQRGV